jgi:PilZ domain-containing protein
MSSPANTRRWPRHPVELPVLVFPRGGDSKLTIQGRGIEMSEGGMTLYAGLPLKPGDYMDVEFQTPGRTRVSAIVRSRTGYCFGLEFLTPLGSTLKSAKESANPAGKVDLRTVLRRKELEMDRLRKEIATLRTYGKFPR